MGTSQPRHPNLSSYLQAKFLALAFLLLPGCAEAPEHAAIAMFQIKAAQPTILRQSAEVTAANHEMFMRTQATLVKSPFVLNSALNHPGVLDIAEKHKGKNQDPIEWLTDILVIPKHGESEVFEIIVTDQMLSRKESILLAEAVAQSYENEVVFTLQRARLKPLEILKRSATNLQRQLRREIQSYLQAVHDRGIQSEQEIQLLVQQIGRLQEEKLMAEKQLQRHLIPKTFISKDQSTDVGIQDATDQATGKSQAADKAPERDTADDEPTDDNSVDNKAETDESSDHSGAPPVSEEKETPSLEREALLAWIGGLDERIERLTEEVRVSAAVDADLKLKKESIDVLEGVARQVAVQIEEWSIETDAPRRINRIPGIQWTRDYKNRQNEADDLSPPPDSEDE